MKTNLKRNIILSVVILLSIIIFATIITTVAYLTSRRNVTGYLQFAKGISIDYKNVIESDANSFGNLQYFNEDNLENLELTNIMPGSVVEIANPKLSAKEGTTNFALRAKLILTDENNIKYETPTEISSLLNGDNKLFESGTIEFADNWEFNSADNYYYFVSLGAGSISERLIEIGYDNELSTQQEIYLFKGDLSDENKVSCTMIDGQPIEKFPVSKLKIELFIEAIQYSAIENWFN